MVACSPRALRGHRSASNEQKRLASVDVVRAANALDDVTAELNHGEVCSPADLRA
jgi:hypothetical protein